MQLTNSSPQPVLNRIQENIIAATMQHFMIPEEMLINGTSFEIVEMRWCVFYLVKNNTNLSARFIGNRLGKQRHAVMHGIESIEVRKKFKYGQTVDDLRKISELAGLSFV